MIAYKLPCSCGNQLTVVAAQAGEMIHCTCGSILEVPTIRKLATLETVADERPVARPWGHRQRVLFLGLLLLVMGLGAAVALQLSRAKLPYDPMKLAPGESMWRWTMLTDWYDTHGGFKETFPPIARVVEYNQVIDHWTFWAGVVAVAGVIVTVIGIALRLVVPAPGGKVPVAAASQARRPEKKRRR